ncbi:MAG: hypothetical protein DMF61_17135 [Blastocatellia bacterium AA13]|nr:MAG: hypothetical protein DMF61_17135 [Blastocatellia bacterium AA13]
MSAIATIRKKLQEVEELKAQAINELLNQRSEIDSQLRALGFKRGRKAGGKRRGRPKGSKNKRTS